MSNQKKFEDHVETFAFILILFGTYLTSFYNYLLFHSFSEMFSIIIAGGIFMIGWNTRENIDNNFIIVVAISFIYVGFFDLIHTLSYSGMNIFDYDANLPTSLWIAARYLQSLSFLLGSLVQNKKLNRNYLNIGYLTLTIFITVSIFSGSFPECYIEGLGLTPFKIVSEYIINLILLITIVVMIKSRTNFEKKTIILILSSICLTMVSELAFTFYISVYGFSNLIGHIFKLIACHLLYKAIIVGSLENPIGFLFRRLVDLAKFPSENPNPVLRVDEQYVIHSNAIGNHLFKIKEKDPIPKILFEKVQEVFETNTQITLDIELDNRFFSFFMIPIKEAGYINIYGRDITERKKAEKKLKEFVSIVSHEIRTPLSVLSMSINYCVKHKGDIAQDVEDQLYNGILRNINLMNKMIDDLLTLSRIDENKLDLDWNGYNLSDMIKKILVLMEPLGKEKQISIKIDIDKSIQLFGDIDRMDQVLRILIDNAIKFSNKDSTIEIEAVDNYKGKYNDRGIDGIVIYIKDQGIGICEKDQDRIFERFFRADNVKDIPGTGLGLSIAKEIVILHGGDIFLESEDTKGTTFILFLPRIKKI